MKKELKRGLSLFVVGLMLISSVPMNALAEEVSTALNTNDISADDTIELYTNTPTSVGLNKIPLLEGNTVTQESGGIISDTVWNNTESAYELTDDIQIKNGVTLTIGPGTIINGNGYSIKIYGTLNIDGATINTVNIEGWNTDFIPYGLEIKNSIITGGSLLNPTGYSGHGNINISDNQFKDLRRYSYIWYPSSIVTIERNVFENCGGFSIGTDYDVYIKNNIFHNCNSNGFVIQSWANYNNSNIYVEYNSFYDDGIVLELKYNRAKMVATNNYWHTTNEDEIATRIKDATIDFGLTEIINFLPILTEAHINTPVVPLTSIALNKTTYTMINGTTEDLAVSYIPENTTDTKDIAWTSSKPAIASVDETGKVTGLTGGKTTITATVGSYTATCEVTVTIPLTAIALNKTTSTLINGKTEQLTVAYTPGDTTDSKTINWTSSDAGVATVDANGKVTAMKTGTVTITATTTDGSKTATCVVTVTDLIVNITEIVLSQATKDLITGSNFNLTATVSPVNATNKVVTWSSDKADIATVDANGKVIAVKAGTATITATTTDGSKTANCIVTVKDPIDNIGATYQTQIQNIGWQSTESNGGMSGTEGRGLRLEGIKINVDNLGYDIGVDYQTQIENIGWQGFKNNGAMSGTSGQSLRLEAIQMKLTGADADKCDIYYQVHAQNYGWLGWAKNGESAGTEGFGYRLEAIKIVVVPKGDPAPGTTEQPFAKNIYCSYQTQVQNIGWQGFKSNGDMSGTNGMGLRLEGIKINTSDPTNLGVEYQTQVENIGWQGFKNNGDMSGTSGQSLRLEAIQIKLTGADMDKYDVYYQVHAQNYGWLGWAKNGESAGTEGFGYRLEAIKVVMVLKGSAAPGSLDQSFVKK